jgi:hypothetical protein
MYFTSSPLETARQVLRLQGRQEILVDNTGVNTNNDGRNISRIA